MGSDEERNGDSREDQHIEAEVNGAEGMNL